jgi:hypothetical protein
LINTNVSEKYAVSFFKFEGLGIDLVIYTYFGRKLITGTEERMQGRGTHSGPGGTMGSKTTLLRGTRTLSTQMGNGVVRKEGYFHGHSIFLQKEIGTVKNDGCFSFPTMVSSQKRNLKLKNRGERRRCHYRRSNEFVVGETHVPFLLELDERPPGSDQEQTILPVHYTEVEPNLCLFP